MATRGGAWLPALTVSIHKMTWVDEALAVAPLAKEQAGFIAMAPVVQAAYRPRLGAEAAAATAY